jgi:ketosteroid isomerase-like protein
MSRENVDLTYRLHGAVNRRDLVGFLSLVDTDVEFTPYQVAIEGGEPYRGHGGVRHWWADAIADSPDLRAELDEVRDHGDVILVHGRLGGRDAESGVSFERTLWAAIEWRDKHVIWWHAFTSEAQALEAVGLRA